MWKTRAQGIPALFLLANSISWFSLTMLIIGDFVALRPYNEILLISGGYFGGLIGSAALGATLFYNKLRKGKFLLSWILSGSISCILFTLGLTNDTPSLALASLILGISTGIGIPTCFSFFAQQTKVENRGKIGAVMFFIVQILSAIVIVIESLFSSDHQFLVLSGWRLFGLAGLIMLKPLDKMPEERKTTLKSIIGERTFILYFLPWFLFTLVNFIEAPILKVFFGEQVFNDSLMATILINSVAAFIGGALCDLKGRKVAGILGFVLLGLGYAFLSFLSGGATKELALYLYIVCDGLAWGILFVTFIFILWGDLSEEKVREKYYFVGSLPFLFSGMIQMLIQPLVQNIESLSTTFSLASFFLFLAIVPLLFAQETLPEKAMKDRDLKSYLEKAQKIADKKSDQKNNKEPEEKTKPKEEEKSEEYDEARKLAEKYY